MGIWRERARGRIAGSILGESGLAGQLKKMLAEADGRKEVLGLWIEQTEGAKFWLKVFNELKNRYIDDVLIAVVDGLRGFQKRLKRSTRRRRSRRASYT